MEVGEEYMEVEEETAYRKSFGPIKIGWAGPLF